MADVSIAGRRGHAGDFRPTKMIHEILPVGLLQCNCHVIGDPSTREAVVIDPGDDVDSILQVIARHGLKVRAILITHAHIDHVIGLKKMRQATGAQVLMHQADLKLYQAMEMQAEWIPCEPLREVEPGRPSQEKLYETWNAINKKSTE